MPAQNVIQDVLTDVNSVVQIMTGMKTIVETLNTPRSVVIVIQNYTKLQLKRLSFYHEHGGFAVTPSLIIDKQQANIYGSQSAGNSLSTGTEGSVVYDLVGENINMLVHWSNPFAGSNSSWATLVPTTSDPNFPMQAKLVNIV